jgi:hypothetical protein
MEGILGRKIKNLERSLQEEHALLQQLAHDDIDRTLLTESIQQMEIQLQSERQKLRNFRELQSIEHLATQSSSTAHKAAECVLATQPPVPDPCEMLPLPADHTQLFVSLLWGEIIPLQIPQSATVSDLKGAIKAKVRDTSLSPLRIMFWGKLLDRGDDSQKLDVFCISHNSALHLVPPMLPKLYAQSAKGRGTDPISLKSGLQFIAFRAVAVLVREDGQLQKSPWNITRVTAHCDSQDDYARACEVILNAKKSVEKRALKAFCEDPEVKKLAESATNRKRGIKTPEEMFDIVFRRQTETPPQKVATTAKNAAAGHQEPESETLFNVDRPHPDSLKLWFCQYTDGNALLKRFVPLKFSDAISHYYNSQLAAVSAENANQPVSCLSSTPTPKIQSGLSFAGGGAAAVQPPDGVAPASVANPHSQLENCVSSSFFIRFGEKGVRTAHVAFCPESPFPRSEKWPVDVQPRWSYRFKNRFEDFVEDAEKNLKAAKVDEGIRKKQLEEDKYGNDFKTIKAEVERLKLALKDPEDQNEEAAENAHRIQCLQILEANMRKDLEMMFASDGQLDTLKAKVEKLKAALKDAKDEYSKENKFVEGCPFVYFPERVSNILESIHEPSNSRELAQDIMFTQTEAEQCRLRYRDRPTCLQWQFDVANMSANSKPFDVEDPDIELNREGQSWKLEQEAPLARWSYRHLTDILNFKNTGIQSTDGPSFVYLPKQLSDALEVHFFRNSKYDVFRCSFLGDDEWEFNLRRMSAARVSECEHFPEIELQREEISWDRTGDGEWCGEWVSMSRNESNRIEDWYFSNAAGRMSHLSEISPVESFLGPTEANQSDPMSLKFVDRLEKDDCVRLTLSRGVSGFGDHDFFVHRHVCSSFRGDILSQCALWPQYVLSLLNDDKMSLLVEPLVHDNLVDELWLSLKSAYYLMHDARQDLDKQAPGKCLTGSNQCFWNCQRCLHTKNFHDIQDLVYEVIHPAVEMCVRLAGTEICVDLKTQSQEEDPCTKFRNYPCRVYPICNSCHENSHVERSNSFPSSLDDLDFDSLLSFNDDASLRSSDSACSECMCNVVCKWAIHLSKLYSSKQNVRSMQWFASKVKRWPFSDGPDQICKLFCKCYHGFFDYFLYAIDTANLCNAILNCLQFQKWFGEQWSNVLKKVDAVRCLRNSSIGHATKLKLCNIAFKESAKQVFEFVELFAVAVFKDEDVNRIETSLEKWNPESLNTFQRDFETLFPSVVDWNDANTRQCLHQARGCLLAARMEYLEKKNQSRSTSSFEEPLLGADLRSRSKTCKALLINVQKLLRIFVSLQCFEGFKLAHQRQSLKSKK